MENDKIPIELEFYDSDTEIWCEFKEIISYVGAIEKKKIYI